MSHQSLYKPQYIKYINILRQDFGEVGILESTQIYENFFFLMQDLFSDINDHRSLIKLLFPRGLCSSKKVVDLMDDDLTGSHYLAVSKRIGIQKAPKGHAMCQQANFELSLPLLSYLYLNYHSEIASVLPKRGDKKEMFLELFGALDKHDIPWKYYFGEPVIRQTLEHPVEIDRPRGVFKADQIELKSVIGLDQFKQEFPYYSRLSLLPRWNLGLRDSTSGQSLTLKILVQSPSRAISSSLAYHIRGKIRLPYGWDMTSILLPTNCPEEFTKAFRDNQSLAEGYIHLLYKFAKWCRKISMRVEDVRENVVPELREELGNWIVANSINQI